MELGCSLLLHTSANLGAAAAAVAVGTGLAAAGARPAASLFAVVEVVLVERSDDGMVCGEYSGGWCAVPLSLDEPTVARAAGSSRTHTSHAHAAGSASPDKVPPMGAASVLCCRQSSWLPPSKLSAWPPASLPDSGTSQPNSYLMAAQPGTAGRLCVPVIAGSPRCLLLSHLLAPQQGLRPPPLLVDGAACRLHYEVRAACMRGQRVPAMPARPATLAAALARPAGAALPQRGHLDAARARELPGLQPRLCAWAGAVGPGWGSFSERVACQGGGAGDAHPAVARTA